MAKTRLKKKAARKATKPISRKAKKVAPRRVMKRAPSKARKSATNKPAPPKWSAAQRGEFDAIKTRAATLATTLKAEDFDRDGNPVNPAWAAMLADLDAWAGKHKVEFRIHEHDHGAPTGTETINVFGKKYKATHTCTLRRQTWLGRCVYSCAETGFAAAR